MRVTAEAAPDGVLVRLAVREGRWAEAIPPAPDGYDVSASFTCEEAAQEHGEALALLGYRVVPRPCGERGDSRRGRACAHVLLPRALAEARPTYWRALLERADGAFDLAFGPVAVAFAPLVSAHDPRGGG